jgi:uncharacterized protein (UPF0333 family)
MRERLFLNLLLILFAIFTLSYFGYQNYYSTDNQAALGQLDNNKTQDSTNSSQQVVPQELPKSLGVKINYPIANQAVPVGKLNISGSSTDTASEDCNVFVDLNDVKPFQNATATGLGGKGDYSNWTFTYTEKYRLITEGKNELTAKLTCNGNDSVNNNGTSNIANEKSKWYSINVTGIAVQAPVKINQNQTQNQIQPASSTQEQKIAALNDKELTTPPEETPKSIKEVAPETESSTKVADAEVETLDGKQPASSTQEQKIAALNDKELTTPPEETPKSIKEVAPETDSSTKVTDAEVETSDNISPQNEQKEEDVRDVESGLPSYPVEEDRVSSNGELTAGNERERIDPQFTQTYDISDEDEVGTQVMDGEEDYGDINHESEESLSMQDEHESQLQVDQEERTESLAEIYELPNGDELGSQSTDNEGDFNDIKSEDEESLSLQDDVETEIQPPLQFFDSDSSVGGSEVDEQQIIHSDDNKEEGSEDIYSMITGNQNEGDDTRDMLEGGHDDLEENSENIIEKEIPLVQTYNEDVKNAIEQNQ